MLAVIALIMFVHTKEHLCQNIDSSLYPVIFILAPIVHSLASASESNLEHLYQESASTLTGPGRVDRNQLKERLSESQRKQDTKQSFDQRLELVSNASIA